MSAAPSAPAAAPTTFADLRQQRPFMRMWFARLFGTVAMQMLMVAIAWHMYELTGSAWDLGLVGLYQFAPALLLALYAGHVVDRHHRGRIVATCLAVQGVVAVALLGATVLWQARAPQPLPAQTVSDLRTLLLAVSVVLGAVRAFQMPAQQALTATLVPMPMLPRAMAFSASGMQAAIICGPALAGFLFVAGIEVVYAVCVALFIVATILIMRLGYVHQPMPREPLTMQTLFGGIEFIWRRKVVLGAISLDLFAVLLGGAVALLPIFAKDILQVGAWGLGLLRSAPAVGALVVSVVLTRWPIQRRAGPVLLGSVAVFGVCMLAFGLSRSFWLSLIVLVVSGGADMVNVVIRQTLVQLETPDSMRGRVSAVNSIFIGASNQLGEFESGATAALIGPVASVVLGGIGTIAVALGWIRLFPALAARDRIEPEPPASASPGLTTVKA